ncbi:MAG: hypothetical protein K2L72_04950, partial [Clostridia bacterium]|nr:hypothetical protein [Clostridia bacterium]
MNIAMCEKEGFEADDLIGTLSKKFDVHSYIYTGDRDSFQLVDDKTDVCYTKRGVSDLLKLSVENFEKEIGLSPKRVIDLKALMGDKSDNIPGVAGVGETTARKLLAEYGDLDGVYANVDGIKSPALRKKLADGKESAYLSYKLATIDRECALDIKLENCRTPQSYSADVMEMFRTFEFKSLIPSISFDGVAESVNKSVEYPNNVIINDSEKLNELCLQRGTYFIDFKNNGANIYFGGVHYTIEYQAKDLLSSFDAPQFYDCLNIVLSNQENKIVVFDYKRILHELQLYGIQPKCSVEDLAVMGYLCDYFNENKSVLELCAAKGYDYNFSAYAFSKIYNEYIEIIERDGLKTLYEEIEKPLI